MKSGFLERPITRILIITAVLGVAGHLLFPLLAPEHTAIHSLWTVGIAVSAFLGSLTLFGWSRTASAPTGGQTGRLKTVFVGNLAFKASRDELHDLFSRYGPVHSVRIMTDRATRRPRGFGFVEMEQSAANSAIKALDGKPFHGRELRVNAGRKRPDREERKAG